MATLGASLPIVIDSFNRANHTWLADFVRKHAKGPIAILGMNYKVGTSETTESAGGFLHNELGEELCTENELPETIVVMLPDPRYKEMDFTGKTVIDPWRYLRYLAEDASVNYVPVGIGHRE